MPPPPPATMDSVEYKKDGTVSRMRSHRGNVPQLPQTKLCPFCPAKFTRTTHLNRHLRNRTLTLSPPPTVGLITHPDTNERLYRCEVRKPLTVGLSYALFCYPGSGLWSTVYEK